MALGDLVARYARSERRAGIRLDGGTLITTDDRKPTTGALEARIGALERQLQRQSSAAKTQTALFEIAELAGRAQDMDEFYQGIHKILGSLLYAENIYIALYDDARKQINFAFYVDSVDTDWPDPRAWEPIGEGGAGGATGYILRTGRVFHIGRAGLDELDEQGAIRGAIAEDFIGVPLVSEGRTVGVIAVQSYIEGIGYDDEDERLLIFVAQHIADALERTRAAAEIRQRNAELALVNEIGSALAKQLDFQAIIDLVGTRVSETFESRDMFVALYDADTNEVSWPFDLANGERATFPPIQLGAGLTSEVIRTRVHLLLHTPAEMTSSGAIEDDVPAGSWLGVPILSGERVLGVIALESGSPHAYSETDQRFLSTLASSTGVALENARLFDETKRLLAETDARAAELAIINEIGAALAKQLDLNAITELVGERIAGIFANQDMFVALYDEPSRTITFPYLVAGGERRTKELPLGKGLASVVIETRRPLRLGSGSDLMARGAVPSYDEDTTESWLGVPVIAGDKVTGVLALLSPEPSHFTEGDERLLATIASSMAVALENARLFDETKRLLAETEQRSAELAVINEVGEALAKQLDFQSIVDLIGARLSQMFSAPDLFIAMYDRASNMISFPYELNAGKRVHGQPIPLGEGMTSEVVRTGRSLRLGTWDEQAAHGAILATYEEGPAAPVGRSWLGVPIVSGAEPVGAVVFGAPGENAFTEADERLVSTIVTNMGVALENARLFEQTNTLLAETKERAAELAIINSVQQGLAGRLDMQSMYDLVGDKIQEIFDAQVVDIGILNRVSGVLNFPYTIERGVRFPDEPIGIVGFRKIVFESRAPLLVNRDAMRAGMDAGQPTVLQGEPPKSLLFVPLLNGGEVTGIISLQNLDREDAFTDGDVRLLTTLAGSLAVALENVRLFDETKRLLAETEQRSAELAVINEVGEALAKQLDFQAIVELIGERMAGMLKSQDLFIAMYDKVAGQISFPYELDQGRRVHADSVPFGPGLTSHVLQTGRSLRIGTHAEQAHYSPIFSTFADGVAATVTGSWLGVPIMSGDAPIGVVAFSGVEENAFTEADERLVSTIVTNMGVALENARLFEQTNTLLAETKERAAELAIINSVQQGLAGRLDMQSVYGKLNTWASRSRTPMSTTWASKISWILSPTRSYMACMSI